jgi:hypothetical protein
MSRRVHDGPRSRSASEKGRDAPGSVSAAGLLVRTARASRGAED